MTILDGLKKAFSLISSRGVRAYGAEQMSSIGYALHGGDVQCAPLNSWFTFAGSPRDDIDKNLSILRRRSRDLFSSNAFFSAILTARRDGVVGRGLRLNAQIDAEPLGLSAEDAARLEHRIESGFARWARNAGADGESFDELCATAYFASILSGDCLALVDMRSGVPRISIVEGDCLRTPDDRFSDPRIQCGIELSSAGRKRAFWVASAYENNLDGAHPTFSRVPLFMAGFNDSETGAWLPSKSGALHVHAPYERPGQLRGVPICSRVLGDVKQLDRYIKAELDASVVAAKPTVFIEHPVIDSEVAQDVLDTLSAGGAESFSPAPGSGSVADQLMSAATSSAPPAIALGNGAIVDLENGAKAQGFNPGRPNQAFSGFVDAIEAQISAALGLPVEVATKKFNSSYSASRAALLDADRTFSIDRAQLIRQFVRPIYCAWLDSAASSLGLAPLGYYGDPVMRDALRGAEWIGEKLPSIDPTKEIDAAAARVALGVSTRARESQELTGTDITQNIRQLAFEEAQLRAYELVKDQNGVPIAAADSGQEV